jgi:hypothetical protein
MAAPSLEQSMVAPRQQGAASTSVQPIEKNQALVPLSPPPTQSPIAGVGLDTMECAIQEQGVSPESSEPPSQVSEKQSNQDYIDNRCSHAGGSGCAHT